MMLIDGESSVELSEEGGASPQTIQQWLSEAKEHHPWFVRAIAENTVWGIEQQNATVEEALAYAMGVYFWLTKRTQDSLLGNSFAEALVIDMATIADGKVTQQLCAFLEAITEPSLSDR